jgi:hypothetical protein
MGDIQLSNKVKEIDLLNFAIVSEMIEQLGDIR